jgi:hypothetical protein
MGQREGGSIREKGGSRNRGVGEVESPLMSTKQQDRHGMTGSHPTVSTASANQQVHQDTLGQ